MLSDDVSLEGVAVLRRVQDFYREEPTRESWPWRHWSAHPRVQAAINRRVSGDPAVALPGALATVLPALGLALPAACVATLGCGRGRLDRTLVRQGVAARIEGFDLSPDSLAYAADAAAAAGLTQLSYRAGDLDRLELEPARYDLIVAEMSLHHVQRLEALYDTVARALKPGGLMVVDEYVGPTRFQWSGRQIQLVNALQELLPLGQRRTTEGGIKLPVARQEEEFFQRVDPSEAIRPGEVLPLLRERFEVLWERPYGGALLHPLLYDIACNFPPGDTLSETLLDAAIRLESEFERNGEIASDFVALAARPR